MSFGHFLRQFLRDARTQRLRTLLTLFGIVWGTAAVTLLLAFGQGLHAQILKSQKGLGDNIVIAWPSRTSKVWEGLPKGRQIKVSDDDIAMLRREVPSLQAISGEYMDNQVKLKVGRKVLVPQTHGITPEFGIIRNMIPQPGGRYVDDLDADDKRRVVFLGDQLAEDLFGKDNAVGKYVMLDGVPFLVVGVMTHKAQDSSYSGRDKDKAIIPASTFEAMYNKRFVDDFVFQPKDPDQVGTVKDGVIATLAHKYQFDPSDKEAIQMWDTVEGLKFLDTFFLAFRVFLGIVGALTLVVGGIGVSNIMNVVVEERTKEIGIKMALGAHRGYVLRQFLFETMCLTVIGGALGFLISWAICAVFPLFKVEEYVGTPVLSWQVASTTTAILGAIGLVAGFFPARSAASLNPVEALRM
ncbi:MAG: ABC transporter permease [Acidobacteriota bacterium]